MGWLIIVLVFATQVGLVGGLIVGSISLGFILLLLMLFFGLSTSNIEANSNINQGIKQSAKIALNIVLVSSLIYFILNEILIIMLWFLFNEVMLIPVLGQTTSGMIYGLKLALFVGFILGMCFGGLAVIQHFALRFVLHRKDLLPWNLVSFMDYATERIFLRKVGGGYVFVHRMLMEYFASLEPGPGVR